jgi:two-component system LytT family response regulator
MLTVAIIDDEQHCTDRLLILLEPYSGNIKTVCFNTADEALQGINTLKPDVVFLDVQLHDKTGFDVLSGITHRDFSLIFTTAYEQYAIKAFKFSAIDYLLKPIDANDFQNALQKASDKVTQQQLGERISMLLSHLSKESPVRKISIPTRDGYSFLNISDIVRCEADVNYTHIFTLGGTKYTVSKPLKHFEGLLASHGFFRIHSSHLINLSYVKAYARSGYVTLLDNTQFDVSIRKREALVKACKNF